MGCVRESSNNCLLMDWTLTLCEVVSRIFATFATSGKIGSVGWLLVLIVCLAELVGMIKNTLRRRRQAHFAEIYRTRQEMNPTLQSVQRSLRHAFHPHLNFVGARRHVVQNEAAILVGDSVKRCRQSEHDGAHLHRPSDTAPTLR